MPAVVATAVLLVGSQSFIGYKLYQIGYKAADVPWQLKWVQRDKIDAIALGQRQQEERDEESRRATKIAAAAVQSERELAEARSDAAAADAAANGLQQEAGRLAQRLAESQTRCDTSATIKRAAETRAALVLADVLSRIDKRAGELAKEADERGVRGGSCQRAYGLLQLRENEI